MKDYVELYINETSVRMTGAEVFMTLADYLRYRVGLTGTKIVCAEGDCGACTVLSRSFLHPDAPFETLNSCIYFVWQLDGHQIITVEGLKREGKLHPAQSAMIECHGAQCGFCTPGFVCSLAQLAEDAKTEPFSIDRKRAQNYLTGNLCRCTGYEPILEAATTMRLDDTILLEDYYPVHPDFFTTREAVAISYQNKRILLPTTLNEAQEFCQEQPQVVAGATDLGVLHNKRKWTPQTLMSLKNIAELHKINVHEQKYSIGANATLSSISKSLQLDFPEFSRLLRIFASPQIKNAATLVGNLMNASPIADTIPFLKVADASVRLLGPNGERCININEFFLPGYKQLNRQPNEIVTHIEVPKNLLNFRLYKVSRRRDLDISAVTAAFAYRMDNGKFKHFAFALGGVAASVSRFKQLESTLIDRRPTQTIFLELFAAVDKLVTPLSDVRGSAGYRRTMIKNFLLKFCDELNDGEVTT